MSDWGGLPTLAPPEYLDRRVQPNSESELRFYSSELGFTNSLKRITPDINSSKRFNSTLSSAHRPSRFVDFPVVRSEVWSSADLVKSSKKRRWIQFKSNFMSCIKSVKCRFTALGILLGLILSLGALIPIVIIWQKSATTSSPTSSSNIGVGSSLDVITKIILCDSNFCDEQVIFTTNMTITKLSLVMTIQRTGNTTYHNTYNSNNGIINSTYTTSATEIIYTFFIQGSQLLLANSYTCAAQFVLPGLNHTTSYDKYTIQVTNICGITTSASGNFL